MFPSLYVSMLYDTVITTLFDNVFRFAVFAIKINGIYIHHVNAMFFFLVRSLYCGHLSLLYSFKPLRNGSSCCPSHIPFDMLGIIQVDGCSTVFEILLQGHFDRYMQFSPILLLFTSCCLCLVKFFHLTQLLMTAIWNL